jgi:hypothetical protein
MQATTTKQERTKRDLRNMASFIRNKGTTGWVKNRSARWHYEAIFGQLVELEDAEGVEATAKLSDRFAVLTDEARRAGLLTPEEIRDAERSAIAAVDRRRN